VVIETPQLRWNGGRYLAVRPTGVNWLAKLELLRSGDFTGEVGKTSAVQLLRGCGYAPPTESGKAAWAQKRITPALLEELQTLQRTVRALYDGNGVQRAWQYRAACKRVLNKAVSSSPKQPLVTDQQMQTWMREHPQAGKPEGGRAALIWAVANYALENRISAEKMPGYRPLPKIEYPEPPYPEAVLRQLLEFTAVDGIDTKLTFDKDGIPVVHLTPRNPVAALLLRAHEATTLSGAVRAEWAACEQCGRAFPKKRSNERGCSPKCKNYLHVKLYRNSDAYKQRTHHAKDSQDQI
jgi:hypothetical protein